MATPVLPWLSVVMPVHGGAQYLARTLASATTSDCEGIEFLVYDSSVDDACRAIAAHYTGRLNIRYRSMPNVSSWPEKTNLAVMAANAPHVAILHQDDIWLPAHVAAVRGDIADQPDTVLSVGPSLLIDEHDHPLGNWSLPLGAGPLLGDAFGKRLIVQNFVAIPAPVIRRDAWLRVGGMDADLWYTADWDLYLKLAQLGSVSVRPLATTAFRIHANSLTMTGSRNGAALSKQLRIVIERHGASFGLDTDAALRARTLASADINCLLAQAADGQRGWMRPAAICLLSLGPANAVRYLRDSRLADRVIPRLRARLSGAL